MSIIIETLGDPVSVLFHNPSIEREDDATETFDAFLVR
jgi:hypothetical protein